MHGFDYNNPGVCKCGDPENLHVMRPMTLWMRVRLFVYDATGKWCPHVEQIPTVGLDHPAHDHSSDASPANVGNVEAVLFCLDCWAAAPTDDERALAVMRRLEDMPRAQSTAPVRRYATRPKHCAGLGRFSSSQHINTL